MKFSVAGLLVIVLTASIGFATEFFVDAGGGGDYLTITEALDIAVAGDTITVQDGTYVEFLIPPRSGTSGAPILLRAANSRKVIVTHASVHPININVKYFNVEGIVFDGQYSSTDVLAIRSGADNNIIRDCEIRRVRNADLIDIDAADDVLIEDCDIYFGLAGSFATQSDSHGIVGANGVFNLTIRNTNIRYVSGDSFQMDPVRQNWSNVLIENCQLWTGALPSGESYPSGWSAGQRPGENAIDTKQRSSNNRSVLTVRNSVIHGFRDTNISIPSALNIKNKVRVFIENSLVYDNYVAFRLRGPGTYGGAIPIVRNNFIYGNTVGIRFEDDVENCEINNNTFDSNGTDMFYDNGSGGYHEPTYLSLNNLYVGSLPALGAGDASNIAITISRANTVFLNYGANEYHLSGTFAEITDVGVDVNLQAANNYLYDIDDGVRPYGAGWDIGADEYNGSVPTPTLTVSSPNGGESFTGGQTVSIQWSSFAYSGGVRVEWYNGSAWGQLTASTSNDGLYNWTIPNTNDYSGCRVRLSAAGVGVPTDNSDGTFTITKSVDTDGDGLDDNWEIAAFGDLSHDGTADSDSDGLTDLQEFSIGSNPNDNDSDSDGYLDGSDPNPLVWDPPPTVQPAETKRCFLSDKPIRRPVLPVMTLAVLIGLVFMRKRSLT